MWTREVIASIGSQRLKAGKLWQVYKAFALLIKVMHPEDSRFSSHLQGWQAGGYWDVEWL